MSDSDSEQKKGLSYGVNLAQKECIPCEKGGPPLPVQEAEKLLQQLQGWMLWPDAKTISKSYKFKNFKEAFSFAAKIADIAESEGHHPELLVSWGRVDVELSTHSIGGLSENDFILAAKIDGIK